MMARWYKHYILPASILASTIIGAGMFALPYAIAGAGWGIGLLYGIALSALVVAVHVMFLQVVLRTEEHYRFTGYVRKYLGGVSFLLSLCTAVAGMTLTLTIYLILSVKFTGLIYQGGEIYRVGLFWALASLGMLLGARLLAVLEYIFLLGMISIIGIIFLLGAGNIGDATPLEFANMGNFFLPFGVLLFALIGRSAIPSVVSYYKEAHIPTHFARRAVVIGTLIPALLYAGFVLGVLGLSLEVSMDTITGLVSSAPRIAVMAIAVLGLLSVLSTYIVVGIDIAENLCLELKVPRLVALGVAVVAPLVCYAVGLRDFFGLIGVVGGIFVSIEAIMIVLMWRKTAGKSFARNLSVMVVLTFLAGALYEIIKPR